MTVAAGRARIALPKRWRRLPPPTFWPLESRIPLTVALVLTVLLAAFGLLGLSALQDSRQHALAEQQLIARAAAQHIDQNLREALDTLERAAALPALTAEDGDLEPKRQAMAALYAQTDLFRKALFLTDRQGTVLWTVPGACRVELGSNLMHQTNVSTAILGASPGVSGGDCSLSAGEPVACLTVPILGKRGEVVGLLGGALDLSSPNVGGFLSALRLGKTGYAQIVDREGIVLASTEGGELFQKPEHGERFARLIAEKRETVGSCHACHQPGYEGERRQDVLAFAPLSTTAWGVAVGQAEEEALAPARTLQQRLLLLTLFSVGLALLLTWLAIRSVTGPLAQLTHAAEQMASGDLSGGLRLERRDEIGRLARAFESMRSRLKASLGEIQGWNQTLEGRVQERTLELERSRQETARLYSELQEKERARTELLERTITAEEEERKRIARELHDDTSQSLSALVFAAETTTRHLGNGEEVGARLERMRELAVATLEGVHRLISDLRPTLLDDLGLAAALRWYAESRLADRGVRVHLEVAGDERRLPAGLETAVYRTAQEAITNVARHAEATNLSISLEFRETGLVAEVEDDGRGFDTAGAHRWNGSHGLGLVGMRERMALVGGDLEIYSERGAGTRVVLRVPLTES